MPAGRAAAQPAPHRPPVAADGAAEAAHEAVAPANALQVAQARLIVSEPRGQLVEAARVSRSPAAARPTARRHATTPGGRKWIAHFFYAGWERALGPSPLLPWRVTCPEGARKASHHGLHSCRVQRSYADGAALRTARP